MSHPYKPLFVDANVPQRPLRRIESKRIALEPITDSTSEQFATWLTQQLIELDDQVAESVHQRAWQMAREFRESVEFHLHRDLCIAIQPLIKRITKLIEFAKFGPEPDWRHEYLHAWEDV